MYENAAPTTVEKTWQHCLSRLSQELPPQTYKAWFEPIQPVSLERTQKGFQLRLQVPSRFFYEWLENRYNAVLSDAVDDVVGVGTEISFHIGTSHGSGETAFDAADAVAEAPLVRSVNGAAGVAEATIVTGRGTSPVEAAPSSSTSLARGDQLCEQYTFDNFIEGDCNRLARSAAQAIAEQPGRTSFNPFLIYGGVGLGKTHLVHSIGNASRSRQWGGRIHYVSSERFTSQFVRAIQKNRVSAFTGFYRQVDLLMVDDIQFFGGKEKTQEEFFHVFNELHQAGKQIVLSADRPPRDIEGIEERLLSRFQWGLTADVQPPDLETRIAILQRKAEESNLRLKTDVIEFIAQRVKTNVRSLEGALVRLAAHATLHHSVIDLRFATEMLRDLIDTRDVPLEIEDIKRLVSDFYRIDPDLLSAKTRRREIVQSRHVAMYCCKKYTQQPLKTIGLRFGGRDHSTVIHACRAVENRLETEPTFRTEVDRLNNTIVMQANEPAAAVSSRGRQRFIGA